MLSRRFSACTTPPNQTTASSVIGHGRLRPREPAMKNTASAPTMREATSFASGDNCRRSSIMPRMSMAAAAPGTASSNARSADRFVSRTDAAVVASAAIANPTPPMLGVATECHRSSRGGAIRTEPRSPIRRTTAQRASDRIAAKNPKARSELNVRGTVPTFGDAGQASAAVGIKLLAAHESFLRRCSCSLQNVARSRGHHSRRRSLAISIQRRSPAIYGVSVV